MCFTQGKHEELIFIHNSTITCKKSCMKLEVCRVPSSDSICFLFMTFIKLPFVSQVRPSSLYLELQTFLRSSGQLCSSMIVFDLLDRLFKSEPSILDVVLLIESFGVEELGRLVWCRLGCISQGLEVRTPRISGERSQNPGLNMLQKVKTAVIKQLGQPWGPLRACR